MQLTQPRKLVHAPGVQLKSLTRSELELSDLRHYHFTMSVVSRSSGMKPMPPCTVKDSGLVLLNGH